MPPSFRRGRKGAGCEPGAQTPRPSLRASAAPNRPGITSSPVSPHAFEPPLTLVQEFQARAAEAGARWARACEKTRLKSVLKRTVCKADEHPR
jgi:hypothetical protein